MKPRSIQKPFVFIIITMMFSMATNSVNAQKPKGNGHGGGHGGGGTFCNCLIRPIPYACGQICGFLINKPTVNNAFSIYGDNSTTIGFELTEAQNVSIKIYDVTGRLVKTLTNNRMPQGDHEIEWNTKDENGNIVNVGEYVLQFTSGNKTGIKKFSIMR